MWSPLMRWLDTAPILAVAGVALLLMAITAVGGIFLRSRHDLREQAIGLEHNDSYEGYVVSAVLGLLALLMGFTFSMAVDRFDARRSLVLAEANAIGTTYLRTQLLEEPHRTRISGLLIAYTDNRLLLAKSRNTEDGRRLLDTNDALITDLWSATVSAFDTIKQYDFSSSYLESMNNLIDLDASRKAARLVRVPGEVFVILLVYMIVTAGVMGYVLSGSRGRLSGAFMLALLVLALALIIDIDRPTRGGIVESQGPMERLRDSLKARPMTVYDSYKLQDARGGPPPPPEARPAR